MSTIRLSQDVLLDAELRVWNEKHQQFAYIVTTGAIVRNYESLWTAGIAGMPFKLYWRGQPIVRSKECPPGELRFMDKDANVLGRIEGIMEGLYGP